MSTRMTSKERVLAAFEYVEPDQVPAWLGASPEFRELARQHLGLEDDEGLSVYLGDDFRRVFASYAGPEEFGPFYNLQPEATYRTPFGVERHGYGYGMPLNRPLVTPPPSPRYTLSPGRTRTGWTSRVSGMKPWPTTDGTPFLAAVGPLSGTMPRCTNDLFLTTSAGGTT